MKWFRLYQDVHRNPKVQELRPELFKFWINFLCVAGESRTRGTVPSEAHLRLALGLGKALVKRWVSELEALALLHRGDDGSLTPHDWHKLQKPSDDAGENKRSQRAGTYGNGPLEMSRDMSRDIDRDKNPIVSPSRAPEAEADGEREELAAAASRTHAYDPPPPEYPESDGLFPIHPGSHQISEEAARDIWRLLWVGWGDLSLCIGFYEHQRFHSEAAWRHALRELASRSVRPKSIRYFETLAAEFDAGALPMSTPIASRPRPPKAPRHGWTYTEEGADEKAEEITERLKQRRQQRGSVCR